MNKAKIYIPWVLLAVIPSLFCVVLSVSQLYSAKLFFAINWDYGFYNVAYHILSDLVDLCRPLAGICFCIVAVVRPFSEKLRDFIKGMRWITAAALLVFAVSFCITSGMEGLPFNTFWGWIANILRVSVIPAAVAYVLIREEKLPDAVRFATALILGGLMVVSSITTFSALTVEPAQQTAFIISSIVVTYAQTLPAVMALVPNKK